eukprot:scaffold72912_cov53-Phaeocystis_antarctica.AAC.2
MASRGRCGQVHHVREEVNLHGEAQGQLVGSRRHRGGRARPAGSSTQSQSRARELRVCLALRLPRRLVPRITTRPVLLACRCDRAACLALLRPRRLRLPIVLPLCFDVGAHSANHHASQSFESRAVCPALRLPLVAVLCKEQLAFYLLPGCLSQRDRQTNKILGERTMRTSRLHGNRERVHT